MKNSSICIYNYAHSFFEEDFIHWFYNIGGLNEDKTVQKSKIMNQPDLTLFDSSYLENKEVKKSEKI